jgi:hypothetical protein
MAAAAKAVQAIVAGTGLAADRQWSSVRRVISAAQTRGGPLHDDAHQRLPHGLGDLGSHDKLGLGLQRHVRLIGRVGGEMEALQVDIRLTHTVIENNAHQVGDGVRPIARAADGAAV